MKSLVIGIAIVLGLCGAGWFGYHRAKSAPETTSRVEVATSNTATEQAKDLERALRAYDSESSKGWPAGDRDLVINMIYKVESSVPEGNLHLVVLRLQDDRVRMFLISDELTVGKYYKASSQRRLLPFNGD